jgi:hypothetical protein
LSEAINVLNNLLGFVDGIIPPPDWMDDSDEKTEIANSLIDMIELLGFI